MIYYTVFNLLIIVFLNIQPSANHLKCVDEYDLHTSSTNKVNNNYFSNIKPIFYMPIYLLRNTMMNATLKFMKIMIRVKLLQKQIS